MSIAAWSNFERSVLCRASQRAAFDFPPAEIHYRNEPDLAKKQVVLSSPHGKTAFLPHFGGLQPAQYQPQAL
jgi:hypothetical protein